MLEIGLKWDKIVILFHMHEVGWARVRYNQGNSDYGKRWGGEDIKWYIEEIGIKDYMQFNDKKSGLCDCKIWVPSKTPMSSQKYVWHGVI